MIVLIGIVGLIVLLPLALAALVFDLVRFGVAAVVALVADGFDRLASG